MRGLAKEASVARSGLSIEQLMDARAKTAARLVLMQTSGLLPREFLDEVRESIEDYSKRIRVRSMIIEKQAKRQIAVAAGNTTSNIP